MERAFSYDSNLVLRTVYLPRDLDEWLRQVAFEQRKSKNEVIRSLLLEARAARQSADTKVALAAGVAR